jgi:hypothetical protein
VELRSRKGYFAEDTKAPDSKQPQESLREVFASPLEATALGLTAAVRPAMGQPGAYDLELRLNANELHLDSGNAKNGTPVWIAISIWPRNFPRRSRPTAPPNSS